MNYNKSAEVDRAALKTGVWYLFSEILIRGVSFLCTPIFTRLLSKSVYGDVKTYESWLYLLTPVLSVGIYNSIERAKFDFKENFDAYVSTNIFMVILLNAFLELLCLPFRKRIAIFLDCPEELVILLFFYTAFYTAILCVQKRERQMFLYKNSVVLSVLSAVLPVSISVICVVFYKGRLNDIQLVSLRVLSFYIPIVVLGMAVAVLAFVRGKKLFNRSYWMYGLRFSAPFIFYAVSMQVLNQSDKIMIKKICGSIDAGVFAVATTVVYIMDVLNNAVQGAWLPWMFEKLNLKEIEQIQKVWKAVLLAMGGITWLIVMAAPELVYFLGGKSYRDAIWLIAPMVTGSLIHFITVGYTNIEKYYKESGCVAVASFCSMGINLILNYFFIQKFDYFAAAYTTATSYFIAVLLHHTFMKKKGVEEVLSIRVTSLITVVFACINLCTMFTYHIPFYFRWIMVIVILGGVLARYREFLFKILYRRKKIDGQENKYK